MLNLNVNNYFNGQFFKICVHNFSVKQNNGILILLSPQKFVPGVAKVPFTDVPYIYWVQFTTL